MPIWFLLVEVEAPNEAVARRSLEAAVGGTGRVLGFMHREYAMAASRFPPPPPLPNRDAPSYTWLAEYNMPHSTYDFSTRTSYFRSSAQGAQGEDLSVLFAFPAVGIGDPLDSDMEDGDLTHDETGKRYWGKWLKNVSPDTLAFWDGRWQRVSELTEPEQE